MKEIQTELLNVNIEKDIIPHVNIDTVENKVSNIYRPLIPAQIVRVNNALKPLIQNNYVSELETPSKWLTPLMLVKKPSGIDRVCLDLRGLNGLVQQDNYPIPNILTLTDPIRNKRIFTKLDLKDAFFRIPLNYNDRCKTAFKVGTKMYQFNVLPMGFKNAPNVFQKFLDHIMADYINKSAVIYIDDILVFSDSITQHKIDLFNIMKILKIYGFIINQEKAKYFTDNIEFLGYEISYNKIKPLVDRVQGIKDFPIPINLKQVRRFIGILNYDRRFLENISETLRPLYLLTQKNVKFIWGDEQQQAFERAKQKLIDATEIIIPDPSKRFTLETDASATGVGAILRQDNGVVGYLSSTLTPTQQNYTITERELYAAMWAMDKFKFYLKGSEFDLLTDHQAIEFYNTKNDFGNSRIHRWFEHLEEYSFVPKYINGEDMILADAMSRSKIDDQNQENSSEKIAEIIKIHESFNHRRSILNDIKKIGIEVSQKELDYILSQCIVCLERDNKHVNSSSYIDTHKPGEKVGIDLLETKNHWVIVLIDYFSRKVFTRIITSKHGTKILEFVRDVYKKFNFSKIISDNGKEFSNNLLKDWASKNNVIHHFVSAYHHKSAGRVERVNQSLRNDLNKTKGPLKSKLITVTDAYNNKHHRAIGMSPNEALLDENYDRVRKSINIYKTEFKSKQLQQYDLNQKVLIKNELRKSKDHKIFDRQGIIKEILGRNTYNILTDDGKTVKRHFSQLKALPGDVVFA